jgi:MarR family transcriptional regulator, organic hydroperoxide resistance regulator
MSMFGDTPDLRALLCFNIYAAGHAFNRFYQPLLEPLGLTYPQYLVLLSLLREDRRGVGDIGADLMLDTNTLSPLLKRMEAMGLVTRQRQTADERRVVAGLTPGGRALAMRAAQIPDCIAECLKLSAQDVGQATDLLVRLRGLLTEIPPPPTPAFALPG